MKSKWIGVAVVIAVAGMIVIYKKRTTPETATVDPVPASSAAMSSAGPVGSVVLVANLAEADEPCVCGKIIRSVRATGTKGVSVKEIDPEKSPELATKYKALVTPSVIIFDGSGREVRRLEGESKETLTAIQAELDRLPAKP